MSTEGALGAKRTGTPPLHFEDEGCAELIALGENKTHAGLRKAFGPKRANAAKILWEIVYWFFPSVEKKSRLRKHDGRHWYVAKSHWHFGTLGLCKKTIDRNLNLLRRMGLVNWGRGFWHDTGNPSVQRSAGFIRFFRIDYRKINELIRAEDRRQNAVRKARNSFQRVSLREPPTVSSEQGEVAPQNCSSVPSYNDRECLTKETTGTTNSAPSASPAASLTDFASLRRIELAAQAFAELVDEEVKTAVEGYRNERPNVLKSDSVLHATARALGHDFHSLAYLVRQDCDISRTQRSVLADEARKVLRQKFDFRPSACVKKHHDWQPSITLSEDERAIAMLAGAWKAHYEARYEKTYIDRRVSRAACKIYLHFREQDCTSAAALDSALKLCFVPEILPVPFRGRTYDPIYHCRNYTALLSDIAAHLTIIMRQVRKELKWRDNVSYS